MHGEPARFSFFPRSIHHIKRLSTEKIRVIHRKVASYPQALGIKKIFDKLREWWHWRVKRF